MKEQSSAIKGKLAVIREYIILSLECFMSINLRRLEAFLPASLRANQDNFSSKLKNNSINIKGIRLLR